MPGPQIPSGVGIGVQAGVGGVGLVPSKYIQPVWGRITKAGPSSSPDYYEWEEVIPSASGKWVAKRDLPNSRELGSYYDGSTLLAPAVEINGGSIEIDTVVRLIPTRKITDNGGHVHRAWLFSNPKLGLRPFRLMGDLIPTGGGELDTLVVAEWLDEPGRHVLLFPEHRTGWPAADQFISLGIGRGPGMYFRGTYGWAAWRAQGTQIGYDREGTAIWRGEWQIVTLYTDLLALLLIYDAPIEPGELGTAQLLWADKNAASNAKFLNSGYSVKLYNNKQVRLEVGMQIDAYFSRPHYIWTPLTVPNYVRHAKIGTAWTNTSHGSDANESVIANECDYAGRNIGKEVTLTTLMKPSHDTAMFPGDVVQYDLLPDGTRIITSDIWDLPIGRVVWESVDTANIRRGWFLCDGNNGTPDLSGRFIMCIDDHGLGAADEDDIGDTGGFRDHGAGNRPAVAADNDHDNHITSQEDPFDDVSGANDLINCVLTVGGPATLDNADFATAECIDYVDDYVHTKTDNRPRYYVMAAIKRVE